MLDEKRADRRSSDSAGSDFSLWSDTGDLAEQLADEEDPLRIQIRESADGPREESRPLQRRQKHVHYTPHSHPEHKDTNPGLSKEAIEIPNPPARQIGRTEKVLAIIMTGDRQKAQMHGLTGQPLLYVPASMEQRLHADMLQVFYQCIRVVGSLCLWLRPGRHVWHNNVRQSTLSIEVAELTTGYESEVHFLKITSTSPHVPRLGPWLLYSKSEHSLHRYALAE